MDEELVLNKAVKAIRSGDTRTAQDLLRQIIKQNPQNEMAWLRLATTIRDPDKQSQCLRWVLKINPSNEIAKKRLAEIKGEEKQTRTNSNIRRLKAEQPAATKGMSQGKQFLFILAIVLVVFIGLAGWSTHLDLPEPAAKRTRTPPPITHAELCEAAQQVTEAQWEEFVKDKLRGTNVIWKGAVRDVTHSSEAYQIQVGFDRRFGTFYGSQLKDAPENLALSLNKGETVIVRGTIENFFQNTCGVIFSDWLIKTDNEG